MARTVKEWWGKTDNTPAPPRVRLRIFIREDGVCKLSGRRILVGEPWQLDHEVAIINGGKNRESNLFPVLVDKHKEKTRDDVAEKSRVAALAKSNAGIRKPSTLRSRNTFSVPAPKDRTVSKAIPRRPIYTEA